MRDLLCMIYYALCMIYYALCTMYYALFTIHYALCTMHYLLGTMHYALCTMHIWLSSCFYFIFLFLLMWDPHVPLYSFLVHLSLETNYFVPVSISFIIIEYSLNICHFSAFSKISFSGFTLNTGLEFRKIFRLSRNLTKLS